MKANAKQRGLVEINVEFTSDENEAMGRTLERYAAIGKAHAPEGTQMFVPPKVKNAMSAQGLTEYVVGLVEDFKNCGSASQREALLDRAIKAQMKAYSLHNLPTYLSLVAGLYEIAGDLAQTKKFLDLSSSAQGEFKPDRIDAIFVEFMETIKGLEEEGAEMSSSLRYQLESTLVAMQLHDSGLMSFSEVR